MDKQAAQTMMQFITAQWITTPLSIAVHLGIADLLARGPVTITELSKMTNSLESSLFRLMRALASVGIFSEKEGKVFEQTPLSACLQSNAMGPIALMFLSGWHNKAWGKLSESIHTGTNAFELAHGTDAYSWFAEHPAEAGIFNKANAMKAQNSYTTIVRNYDFSGIHSFTDIGGGLGILAAEILKNNPHIKGTIADLSSVLDETQRFLVSQHIEERCGLITCDFFKRIPSGSELYLMANVLHNWEDEKCGIIIDNCRTAMNPGSRLLIIEMILPPGNTPSVAKLLDLEVLVMGGGKERTREEFTELCSSAGFRVGRIIPGDGDFYGIECMVDEG
ncbi:MAG: hypothetical protein JXJ04_14410 [Spirochaetales bacterium]|nr:hypothetical protein [Spirochaetales bacterium]